jgi:alpha-aminoadipate carrier protein LysW
MPICSECENPLDFDEEDVDEGDVIVCDECGTEFEVVAIDPIELTKVDEDYDEEDEVFSEEEEEEE